MRVIAGRARGMRLATPKGMGTRPTADRVREALFSILCSRVDLDGLRILDVCAGTGSLGIEALSRGAETCCFVEHDRSVMTLLEKNVAICGMTGKSECVLLDAIKGLQLLSRQGKEFDIVFLDPPYQSNLYDRVFSMLNESRLATEESLVIAECASRAPLPDKYGRFNKIDRRVYGDTALEFFAEEHT